MLVYKVDVMRFASIVFVLLRLIWVLIYRSLAFALCALIVVSDLGCSALVCVEFRCFGLIWWVVLLSLLFVMLGVWMCVLCGVL